MVRLRATSVAVAASSSGERGLNEAVGLAGISGGGGGPVVVELDLLWWGLTAVGGGIHLDVQI